MSFRVLGTNHTSFTVSNLDRTVAIDLGPNKGRKVVYLRDWDGITIELIETKTQ